MVYVVVIDVCTYYLGADAANTCPRIGRYNAVFLVQSGGAPYSGGVDNLRNKLMKEGIRVSNGVRDCQDPT